MGSRMKIGMCKRSLPCRRRRRHGAIFSFELLIVLPVLVGILLATIELSLLLHSNCRLKEASRLACRVAARPCHHLEDRERAIRKAIEHALHRPNLVRSYECQFDSGRFPGDVVFVQLSLPMKAAAPDLLAVIGFGLKDRRLYSRTVMYKE
jgi:hypothetical protein